MPEVPIVMPQLGESIAEALILSIDISLGDAVAADQEIIEVETNKAVMSVTTPCAGTVQKIIAMPDESYPVGATLGYLEVTEDEAKRSGVSLVPLPPEGDAPVSVEDALSSEAKTTPDEPPAAAEPPEKRDVEPTVKGLPVPARATGASYISPRMRARMEELRLNAVDLAGMAGTGAAGRLTVDDFEAYLEKLESQKMTPASPMRIAVADSMRRSWTRPLATVGAPVSLDAVLAHRKTQELKAGPALYSVRALALALSENTAAAGRLVGERIVHPAAIDIGFAVEVEDGGPGSRDSRRRAKAAPGADSSIQRTRAPGAGTPAFQGREPARNRHRDELRQFRHRVGHPHSSARTESGSWTRSRPQGAFVGRGLKPVHSGCRGPTYP